MFFSKKFLLFLLFSQIFLYEVTPRSHFHSGGLISSIIDSIIDHSDDDTPPPEENPGPSTTPPSPGGEIPNGTPEELSEWIGGVIPPLGTDEDPLWLTELKEILEEQENNVSIVENYPTNVLDGSFTEYEQEAAWSTENEAYEFEDGEIVGYGYIPIDPETASNHATVQDALEFGSAFVIKKGVENGELASDAAQLQQLLAVSFRSLGNGIEFEFHVEIVDLDAQDDSKWPQAFFTVFVEAGSRKKGVTSYYIFNKKYLAKIRRQEKYVYSPMDDSRAIQNKVKLAFFLHMESLATRSDCYQIQLFAYQDGAKYIESFPVSLPAKEVYSQLRRKFGRIRLISEKDKDGKYFPKQTEEKLCVPAKGSASNPSPVFKIIKKQKKPQRFLPDFQKPIPKISRPKNESGSAPIEID